jgi:haloalkane dehalogenase
VHLVVHDWGGAIGFGWAVRHPDKVGRIVILNTAAFPSPQMPLRIRLCQTPLVGEWLMRGLNGFVGAATWMAVNCRPLAADVKRGYLFPYDSWANRIGVARFVADIPMRAGHPSRALLEETYRGLNQFIKNPVMIAWGGADFCFNDWSFTRWQKILPRAAVHYFSDAGHYVLEDAGEVIVPEIVAFLDSH